MTEWDPYYAARGLRRRLPEDFHRHGALDRERHRRLEGERKEDASLDRELADAVLGIVLKEQRAEMEHRLADLEAANTEALLLNTEAMEAVRTHIRSLLDRAFVLPDGRRIFRTEDGTQVFDEYGEEITADILDPATIDDHRPTWEDYSAAIKAEAELERERADLLERQNQLDTARERFDNGDLTDDDLDALEMKFERPGHDSVAPDQPPISTDTRLSAAENSSARASPPADRFQPTSP